MGRSLADYIYTNLDRIADITPEIETRLNMLFNVWNARNISVEDFRSQNGFDETAGIYSLIPYMTEYLVDKAHDRLEAHRIGK